MRVTRGPAVARKLRGIAIAATLVVAAACATDEPTSPYPGRYTLSGRVRLTGFLVNANGQFAGTRVVDDADGVRVELTYGSTVQAHATTVDGVYRFPNLSPGAYQTRAAVVGPIADKSNVFTIVDADLVAGDTLRLTSAGDLYPWPNPAADSVSISFNLAALQMAEVNIENLEGTPIRNLWSGPIGPGLRVVRWDGRDSANNVVRGSMYWVTFESGLDIRAQLLFR